MSSLRAQRKTGAPPPAGLLHPVALAVAPSIGRWLFTKGPRRFIPFVSLSLLLLLLYGLSFIRPGDPVSVLHDLTFFAIGISATLFGTAGGLVGAAVISILLGPLAPNHILTNSPLDWPLISIQFIIWESFGFMAGAVVETVQAYFARVADAESKLAHAEKMEAIGRLTGGVAHDFNNMLTAIGGYCELIKVKAARLGIDSIDGDVDEALMAVRRASELTHQLLAISRKQVMSPRQLDLAEEVSALTKMLSRLVGEIRIETIIAPTSWRVTADPVQLTQVIMNLVVNARDAMPGGGTIEIEVGYLKVDATLAAQLTDIRPGDFATITVRDTGLGIDEEVMAHIFEPFYTTKEEGKGTGLGLSTSMGIIRQLGGDIWAYSDPGVGTTFKIFLPRAADEDSDEIARIVPVLSPRKRRATTILVVDDNETVLQVVTGMLNSQGFIVLSVPDGKAALATLDRRPEEIALVITDVVMPGMSGLSLAEAVRTRCPRMKIILTSGYSRRRAEKHEPICRYDGYLEKPVTARAVSEVVDRVLS